MFKDIRISNKNRRRTENYNHNIIILYNVGEKTNRIGIIYKGSSFGSMLLDAHLNSKYTFLSVYSTFTAYII